MYKFLSPLIVLVPQDLNLMCKMGLTGLHDSLARVLAFFIVWLSRVYL